MTVEEKRQIVRNYCKSTRCSSCKLFPSWCANYDKRTCPESALDEALGLMRWTKQEVKDAKAIRRILPEARDIERITETLTVVRDEDGFCLLTLQKDMFPNVKEGPAVKLADIIGGNT